MTQLYLALAGRSAYADAQRVEKSLVLGPQELPGKLAHSIEISHCSSKEPPSRRIAKPWSASANSMSVTAEPAAVGGCQ